MEAETGASLHHPSFWLLSFLPHILWSNIGPGEQSPTALGLMLGQYLGHTYTWQAHNVSVTQVVHFGIFLASLWNAH